MHVPLDKIRRPVKVTCPFIAVNELVPNNTLEDDKDNEIG